VLAALQATAISYLARTAVTDIPLWRMVARSVGELEHRAESVCTESRIGTPAAMASMPGAGSAPGVTMPSFGIVLRGDHLLALRSRPTPIIARVRDGLTFIDLRAVEPEHDELITDALRSIG
jgi:L-seryl-tRNA(Ser) seleniumtransferase